MELTKEIIDCLKELQNEKLKRYNNFSSNIEYNLLSMKYFQETNSSKIVFQKKEKYRTIERYVQRNYQRYPVYSDLKTRTFTTTKTFKINNQALEELNTNNDFLIKLFCYEILIRLNEEDFLPSWAKIDIRELLHLILFFLKIIILAKPTGKIYFQ